MDLSEATRIVGGGAGLDSATGSRQLDRFAADRRRRDGGHPGHHRSQLGRARTPDRHHRRGRRPVELYLSFGISGAVQHTSGLGHPDHVISVNTDPHCPMMQMSDLAIVADANARARRAAPRWRSVSDAKRRRADEPRERRNPTVRGRRVVVGAGPAGSCAATVLARVAATR
jgi:electron transfer flavoprotein alpha subunit